MIISLDSETNGLDHFHKPTSPFFITVCFEDGEQVWWEWNVNPLTREVEIPEEDAEEIKDIVAQADRVVAHNSKFDSQALELALPGFCWPWDKTEDTLVAGHLLASAAPHDLTSMTMHYLNVDIEPHEKTLKEVVAKARRMARRDYKDWRIAKKGDPMLPSAKGSEKNEGPWKFDCWLPKAIADAEDYAEEHEWRKVLTTYANADSAATVALWPALEKEIKRRGYWKHYRWRMRGLEPIFDMEKRGVTASESRLENVRKKYSKASWHNGQKCLKIAADRGRELKLPKSGNNKALLEFCFQDLRLPVIKSSQKTGNPSLDAETLRNYLVMGQEPQAEKFLTGLQNKRLYDTACNYLDSYKRFWQQDGAPDVYVLHPSLNLTGTAGLRCSSSNPNSQNVGKKEAANLRTVFGPPPGFVWVPIDYENIELRIPAFESGEESMIELFEKPDEPPYFGSYHLLNASIIYPDLFWPLAQKKGEFKKRFEATWYQWVKNFGFALQYGCGEKTGDRTARKDGAWRMVKQKLPKMEKLNQKYVSFANRFGYVETLPDKTVDPRRGFPVMCMRGEYNRISPTIPLNYHVQPTAMWATLGAMVDCFELLKDFPKCRMVLQVHDEIVFQIPVEQDLSLVRELQAVMEAQGDKIGIPLKASAKVCRNNWAEAEGLEDYAEAGQRRAEAAPLRFLGRGAG